MEGRDRGRKGCGLGQGNLRRKGHACEKRLLEYRAWEICVTTGAKKKPMGVVFVQSSNTGQIQYVMFTAF